MTEIQTRHDPAPLYEVVRTWRREALRLRLQGELMEANAAELEAEVPSLIARWEGQSREAESPVDPQLTVVGRTPERSLASADTSSALAGSRRPSDG